MASPARQQAWQEGDRTGSYLAGRCGTSCATRRRPGSGEQGAFFSSRHGVCGFLREDTCSPPPMPSIPAVASPVRGPPGSVTLYFPRPSWRRSEQRRLIWVKKTGDSRTGRATGRESRTWYWADPVPAGLMHAGHSTQQYHLSWHIFRCA